jgi:hypothetical protein
VSRVSNPEHGSPNLNISDDQTALADDTLFGAEAISLFLFGTPDKKRQVYRLSTEVPVRYRLPVFKLGSNSLCARKSAILHWIKAQETARTNEDLAGTAA